MLLESAANLRVEIGDRRPSGLRFDQRGRRQKQDDEEGTGERLDGAKYGCCSRLYRA
jgi:hypothetical protein